MSNRDDEVAVVILAAGASTRMGKPKQVLPIQNETLLSRAIRSAKEVASTVVVVLGSNHTEHQKSIHHLDVISALNPDWNVGMGTSIKCGVSYLNNNNPGTKAVIIMVCDQPLLTSGHLKKIIEEFHRGNSKIIASEYNGSVGVPALFDKSFFHELMQLDGTQGAKKIIHQNQNAVLAIPFPGGAVDLDTPEDYNTFIG